MADPLPPLALRARQSARLSQDAFATAYGLDLAAVKNWEQGRRQPDRAARVLLLLIEAHPVGVAKMIAGVRDRDLGTKIG